LRLGVGMVRVAPKVSATTPPSKETATILLHFNAMRESEGLKFALPSAV